MDHPRTDKGLPIDRNGSADSHPSQQSAQPVHFDVDDTRIMAGYANFCRLSGTPEELLIDFAFQPQMSGVSGQSIEVTQRIVTGWHTAKRLLQALQMTLQRHEAAFGYLETNAQTRAGNAR